MRELRTLARRWTVRSAIPTGPTSHMPSSTSATPKAGEIPDDIVIRSRTLMRTSTSGSNHQADQVMNKALAIGLTAAGIRVFSGTANATQDRSSLTIGLHGANEVGTVGDQKDRER